jgi:uncharacterized protein YyaL (SSP411 family)
MNLLNRESSLYLLQHADNPVHWRPWDDAALEQARDLDSPILLSIGYSACHWCHVMAHESFEHEETAEVMNTLFVNIKVDREERPDLDRIYQLSHQLLTGRGGGWPLTVFLDPADLTPFFAGTYFPREPRYGMPAFRDLLFRVRGWFDEARNDIRTQNRKLTEAIAAIQRDVDPQGGDVQSVLRSGASELLARHDPRHGGYGDAPKFPQAPLLNAVAVLSSSGGPDSTGLGDSLEFTLEQMACGGLRDHLDGGFFRYCVDADWTIPHFEKMLYDNALLLPLYAEAAGRRDKRRLAVAARGIAGWLISTMGEDGPGFAASIDADAGGKEGAFHVWQRDEVRRLLRAEQYPLFARTYGLDGPPNFEDRDWHLVRHREPAQDEGEEKVLARARERLLEHRASRVSPVVDTKRLTAWNALAIEGLARAGRALQCDDWLERAGQAVEFIHGKLWNGRKLMAVYNAQEATIPAYLDDYAYLIRALLLLLQDRFRPQWLEFATKLANVLLDSFQDQENGGFYFTDACVEAPIARSMIFQDEATPAGNAAAVTALSWLGQLTGEHRYVLAATRTLERALPRIEQSPAACAGMLAALYEASHPRSQLIVSGTDVEEVSALGGWVRDRYRVNCYAIDPRQEPLPGVLGQYESDEPVAAWLCTGMRCLPPVHSLDRLKRLLEEQEPEPLLHA